MVGDRRPGEITRALPQLIRKGVEIVQAEVRALNLDRKQVETSAETLQYDYLIVALGAELALEALPGLREAAHTFYTMEGSVKLHDALQGFSGGRLAGGGGVPYRCPGAPNEGTMLIADFLRRGGRRDKTEVDLYTPEAQPLPVAGPEVGAAVRSMLEERGIGYHPLHKLIKEQRLWVKIPTAQ
jgi:sulfide:quinone oxidoreductase